MIRDRVSMLRTWALASWVTSAAMAGVGVWHLLHAVTDFGEWRRWRTADPSLADFFWTELDIELVLFTGSIVIAGVLAVAARRVSKSPEA